MFQIILLVGTKLELVIVEMAQQIQDRTTVVRGAPLVEPSNNFFWFNRPQWILFLIHFTLFQVNHGVFQSHHKIYLDHPIILLTRFFYLCNCRMRIKWHTSYGSG